VDPTPNAGNGRDNAGRFAPGNAGGPGNPIARETAALRKAVLEAASEDCLREILEAVIEKARRGNLAAAGFIRKGLTRNGNLSYSPP